MAKKSKKTKITETLVNQLQEVTPEKVEVEEEKKEKEEKVVVVEKKKTPHHPHKPAPQKSKLFDKLVKEKPDSETDGISFNIFGVL